MILKDLDYLAEYSEASTPKGGLDFFGINSTPKGGLDFFGTNTNIDQLAIANAGGGIGNVAIAFNIATVIQIDLDLGNWI